MPLGSFRLNGLGKYFPPSGPNFLPNADPFAGNLRLALPLNSVTEFDDVSHLVTGSPNSQPTTRSGPNSPTRSLIVTEDSQYYGSSYKQINDNVRNTRLVFTLQQSWLPFSTDYTIEWWFKTTRTSNNSWFISNRDVGGRFLIGFYISGNPPGFISTNDQRILVPQNQWHHVVIQRNGWYFNGTRRGGVFNTNLTTPISEFHIGQQNNNDRNDWAGYLNDFRLYIGVNKYGSATSITTPGPIGTIL